MIATPGIRCNKYRELENSILFAENLEDKIQKPMTNRQPLTPLTELKTLGTSLENTIKAIYTAIGEDDDCICPKFQKRGRRNNTYLKSERLKDFWQTH